MRCGADRRVVLSVSLAPHPVQLRLRVQRAHDERSLPQMSTNYQPRKKDHISIKLHLRRPSGAGSWLILLVLALVQTILLVLTTSAIATNGSLYGCSPSCGTRAQPATPALAIIYGVLILVLPIVIGALSPSWQAAVALATVPVVLAIILDSGTLLTPTMSFVSG